MADEFKLPKQVQDNADAAEEFMGKLGASEHSEDPEEVEEVAEEVEEEPEEEDPAADEPEEVLETEDPEPDPDEESYRKRYETLQGKYNAEVPRLHQEIREFKEKVFKQFGDLQAEKETPKEEPTPDEYETVYAELSEEFDEDILRAMDRLTEAKFKRFQGQQLAPIQERLETSETEKFEVAQSNFMDEIDQGMAEGWEGDWRDLWSGKDPEFLKFLDTKHPSGMFTYREVANLANQRWDSERIVMVFNEYLNQSGQVQAAADPDPEPNEEQKTEKKKDPSEEARIQPRRKQPATPEPEGDEPIIWTKESMAEFQRKDQQGKIPQEESQKLWDDLLRAPAENRMRN